MATRFYLPATAAPTAGLTPTVQGAWTDTSILARAMMSTSKIGDTMTTVSFADSSVANLTIIFRQWLSAELTAGQTITGAQTWAIQARCAERLAGNNMFLARAIYVIAGDGSTLRKTLVALSLDGLEATVTTLTNRVNGGLTVAGNYTTVAGDRILLELGMSGDPSGGGSPDHDSDMSFGDDNGTDLPVDDTTTAANNPWFELTDNLTFVAPTLALTGTVTTAYESDIVTGGKTIILTLTGASWISAALFNAQRQNIINGIDSAQSEAAGWDATVKATQGVVGVVRTSDTVVTITLDAQASYSITANETITATIPASAISGGVGSVASPTFTITEGAAPAGNRRRRVLMGAA